MKALVECMDAGEKSVRPILTFIMISKNADTTTRTTTCKVAWSGECQILNGCWVGVCTQSGRDWMISSIDFKSLDLIFLARIIIKGDTTFAR